MTIYTESDPKYSILDLGFDKSLTKSLLGMQGLSDIPPELMNVFTAGVAPKTLISGELISVLEQKAGVVFSGKTDFSNDDSGYRLGIENAVAKFYIGNDTDYFNWTGTAMVISGALSAGSIDIGGSDATSFHVDVNGNVWVGAATYASAPAKISNAGALIVTSGTIGGFTIGATTITGSTLVLDSAGSIKTATSGQRIVIDSADNLIHIYDATVEVLKLGTATATAATFTLNANNTDGIKITSATDATLGIRIDSSSNVTLNALRIALTNTGTGNDGYGMHVKNYGTAASSYCIDVDKQGVGTAVRVFNTGTGATLSLNQSNSSGAYVLEIYQNHTSNNNDVVHIDNIGVGIGLNVLSDTAGANYAISILHASSGVSSIFIDKNSSGPVIEIDQDVNNTAACYGLSMSLANAGSGIEYAFDFQGSEITSAAVGGSQDKKIKIRIGAADYFIPCYTT